MQRETTEEDCQHDRPFEVLEECIKQAPLADSVSHDCKSNVSETVEDDNDGEPNLPRIDVVFVQVTVVPSDSEVVGSRHDPCCTDSVVGTNVGNDGDFGGESDVGEQESAEKRGEGTLVNPFANWVEEKFVATVGVFLPSCKFIVDRKRHTFLESFTSPSS